MLEVRNIGCHRGDRILFDALSFSVAPGNAVWVSGPNGSGKTTLLRALVGLCPIDRGAILWQNREISDCKEEYIQQMAYIGHRNALKDDLTAIENLQAIARTFGNTIDVGTARSALDAVGLSRQCHLLATRWLSEGQKRRVALARLWFCLRPLWILDEPFTALDAHSSQIMRERLQRHMADRGFIVVASHEEIGIQPGAVHRLTLPG